MKVEFAIAIVDVDPADKLIQQLILALRAARPEYGWVLEGEGWTRPTGGPITYVGGIATEDRLADVRRAVTETLSRVDRERRIDLSRLILIETT